MSGASIGFVVVAVFLIICAIKSADIAALFAGDNASPVWTVSLALTFVGLSLAAVLGGVGVLE